MSKTAAAAYDPPRQCRDGLRRRSRSLLQNIPPHHQSAMDAKGTEGELRWSVRRSRARPTGTVANYDLAYAPPVSPSTIDISSFIRSDQICLRTSWYSRQIKNATIPSRTVSAISQSE